MKKIVMLILDGAGLREEEAGNALKTANMQNFNYLLREYPNLELEASEEHVGLTKGQFGNSEVGHMSIGAGRLVKQNETLVDEFLKDKYIDNEIMNSIFYDNTKTIHLMGLASDGNVHAGIDDFINMYRILVKKGFKSINFHLITDGRDTGIHSSTKYVEMIEEEINKYKTGKISTICGRYYAMDRDENYDRTKKYYNLIAKGRGITFIDSKRALEAQHQKEITDEFIKPLVFNQGDLIKNEDVVIWMNYRADRSKQILNPLVNENFDKFATFDVFPDVYTFFPIDKKIVTKNFLELPNVKNPLGLYLADLGITQARIAESEKFAHVTYFFDGGYDGSIENCEKIHVPSPKVETYDLKPEMSIIGVTKEVEKMMEQETDFILVNFANLDMVGHTGNFEATVKACMAVDLCLGKIYELTQNNFYTLVVLADHGNAEDMLFENGEIKTTHTTSKVPFIVTDKKLELKDKGSLSNVAPTILTYMEVAIPKEMIETETLLK